MQFTLIYLHEYFESYLTFQFNEYAIDFNVPLSKFLCKFFKVIKIFAF